MTAVVRAHPTQSIAFRLGAAMALILVLVVLATIAAAGSYGQAAADETFDRLLRGAALQMAERVSVTEAEVGLDLPVSAFELLSLARTDRVFYRVIGPDGATLTGYDDLPVPGERGTDQIYDAAYKGFDIRGLRLTRHLAERTVSGEVVVAVAQTTEARQALAQSITTQAVLLIAGGGIALLLLALIVVRVALRPLARVEQAILSRDANDLSPIDLPAPEEVAELVGAINRFMGRLDRRIEAMQNFVADAAHQIRTPITAMRAHAQLALEETDPGKLERLHRRLYARSVGLGRLADQLLSQALVSHRADAAAQEDIDLRRVALEAERELRAAADAAVTVQLPDDAVMVRGDLVSLREAVKNLLNNAVRHGSPPVTLLVTPPENGRVEVLVRDRGAGIPEALAARIGQRFTSDGISPESAGLGLSIIAAVAAAHHAELVRRTTDEGFEIGLRMRAEP